MKQAEVLHGPTRPDETAAESSIQELIDRMIANSRREKSIITFTGLKPGPAGGEPFVIAVAVGSEADRLLGLISLYNEIIEEAQ